VAELLVVDQLPRSLSDDELIKLFRPFGKVISCTVVRSASGRSLGFGFVEMERSEDAFRAVSSLDNQPLQTEIIKVRRVKDFPAGAE
jgi:RNA recognition motif-containing protein